MKLRWRALNEATAKPKEGKHQTTADFLKGQVWAAHIRGESALGNGTSTNPLNRDKPVKFGARRAQKVRALTRGGRLEAEVRGSVEPRISGLRPGNFSRSMRASDQASLKVAFEFSPPGQSFNQAATVLACGNSGFRVLGLGMFRV